MKRNIALQVFAITSLMQSPAIAQTYSSFFEGDVSSFGALEDSFAPSGYMGDGDFMNGYRDARGSYIDAIKTINYFNSESKLVGRESAVIGEIRSYFERGVGSVNLDSTVRTTGMGCFVTQVGASGC